MMSLSGKRLTAAALFLLALVTVASTYDCPEDCHCIVIKGAHPQNHAKCSSVTGLLEGKSLPIHSIDLSHAGITKIYNHLEKLRDLTSIDLSHNQLSDVGHIGRRVKTLNLNHNRITSGKLSRIPAHVQHLDLSHNEISYLPEELTKLAKLSSLELAGNKINCSCETLKVRNWLQEQRVYTGNHIKCAYPFAAKGKSWLQVKLTEICEHERTTRNAVMEDDDDNELMMGDQPADDDDELGTAFMRVNDKEHVADQHSEDDDVEGSGDLSEKSLPQNEASSTAAPHTEEEEDDGSGSGSGPIVIHPMFEEDEDEHVSTTTAMSTSTEETTESSELGPSMGIAKFGPVEEEEEQHEVNEETIVPVKVPETFEAPKQKAVDVEVEKPDVNADAHSEKAEIVIGQHQDVNQAQAGESKGTYILLGILLLLVVGLVLFVILKRKTGRRASHEFDPERATELADMDKANLGKPLNGNGRHEHAPLIDEKPKAEITKNMNGNNRAPSADENEGPTQEPLLDNESNNNEPELERLMDTPSPVPTPRHTLDTPHRIIPRYPPPKSPRASKQNGADDDSFYASSPRSARYSPVYSPETGKVKIKLTETPKPKTPMLVTRSKSNAGDIITTPVAAAANHPETNNNVVG